MTDVKNMLGEKNESNNQVSAGVVPEWLLSIYKKSGISEILFSPELLMCKDGDM